MTYDYKKTYTLRSGTSDFGSWSKTAGQGHFHGLGTIQDIEGFPETQIFAEKGKLYVLATDDEAFDQAAKVLVQWRHHQGEEWGAYDPSLYKCRAIILGRNGCFFPLQSQIQAGR